MDDDRMSRMLGLTTAQLDAVMDVAARVPSVWRTRWLANLSDNLFPFADLDDAALHEVMRRTAIAMHINIDAA